MKRGARLAALLAALAVLIGAWVLAETMSGRRQASLAEHAHEEPIDLGVGPAEEVNAVSWNYFGDAVNLKYDGETWINAEDEACPIDDAAVQPLVDAVSSTKAVGVIEDVTDFDQYGLADPAIAVMAATADKVTTYYIGDSNASGTWYVRLDGDDKVYLEDGTLAGCFQLGLDDVLALDSVAVSARDVTALTVRSGAGDYALEKLEDAQDVWYTDAFPWYLMDGSQAQRPLDTAKTETLIGLAADISLTQCVSWDAEDEADYGLDEPQATVELSCGGGEPSVTLQFGDYDDEGDVYVRPDGSALIYAVAGTVLDGLMYPDFDDLLPLSPAALDWDRLTGMTLDLEEGTYEVEKTLSAQEGEEPEPIYTEGGRSLDPEQVGVWLDQVAALPADSRTGANDGRGELFSLVFRQDSEAFPEVTVTFCAYDSAHRLCVVNGEEYYLVSRTTADAVERNAAALFKELPAEEE